MAEKNSDNTEINNNNQSNNTNISTINTNGPLSAEQEETIRASILSGDPIYRHSGIALLMGLYGYEPTSLEERTEIGSTLENNCDDQ